MTRLGALITITILVSLRSFSQVFGPKWLPRYHIGSGGLALSTSLLDLIALGNLTFDVEV